MMLSALIGVTILLLAAWGLTAALQRHSAAVRHVTWTCAVAATLLYAPLRWRAPRRVVGPPLPAVFTPTVLVTAAPVMAGRRSTLDFADLAGFAWALGSALFALRLFARTMRFRKLVANAKSAESAGPVPILISPRVPGPLVARIFHPVILLPEEASHWTPSRRRAVLAHELAHIRRRDPIILLIAELATVAYWFHPLCRLAAAHLRIESERACDDAALRIGFRPSGYAGHLLDLARLFNPQPAIPMATTSHLESRVKSILDPLVNRSSAARRTWLAAAVITAAVTAPLTIATLHAQTSGSGTIRGNISDPTGAVVPHVRIIASNGDAGNREVTTADAFGNFALENVPAGNYSVDGQAPGFAPFHLDITLLNGATVTAPVKLAVGKVAETITVLAPGTPRPPAASPSSAGTAPGVRVRVGGMVQNANLIQQVRPVYPAALQAAGIEGTVLLDAVISKDGTPVSLQPRNTTVDPAFVTAATDAISQWRYRPTLLNGEPVEVLTTITIEFKLQTATALLNLKRSIDMAKLNLQQLQKADTPNHPSVEAAEARLAQLLEQYKEADQQQTK